MNFIDLVKKRKSSRNYDPYKNINKDDLEYILNSARFAPSAKNIQPWKFLITENKENLLKMVPMCKNQEFIKDASLAIICGSDNIDYKMTCGQYAYVLDVSIAMTHMCLAATEKNISSCWLGAFYEDQIKNLFKIPQNIKLVGILILGYAKENINDTISKNRKEITEFTSYETWNF